MSASTTPRYGTTVGKDNTGRVLTQDFKTPGYAATISIAASKQRTTVKPATLTGAVTFNAVTTDCFADDELVFLLTADTTARVATFGTNFVSAGTLTAAISKRATATFKFDGAVWVEISRFVQP
jgi:hypothetical protein